MIHQFIFAAPKPGLSAQAFASYWLNFHAPDYAAKIPQIRRYLVGTPLGLDTGRDVPDFAGAAEIWLREDEQIASLQSPEFLLGARADEPRWAAYWQTLALDTDAVVLTGEPEPPAGGGLAKLYCLLKRAPELSRAAFRECLLADRAGGVRAQRHLIGFCRDALYGLGEPRFDAVEVIGFSDRAALAAALDGTLRARLREGRPFLHPATRFGFTAQEHWVIRSP